MGEGVSAPIRPDPGSCQVTTRLSWSSKSVATQGLIGASPLVSLPIEDYGAYEPDIRPAHVLRKVNVVNKAELIEVVAERLEDSKKAAGEAVEVIIDEIAKAVAAGEKVAITGFGVFERVERAARTGRNPMTGAVVKIKATSVPKFRPGAEFKGLVSGKKKPATRKAAAKKAPAKKAPAKKATAKKAPARKAPAKKAPARSR